MAYLPTHVRGQFYYLYMIVDTEVFDQESMTNSSELIQLVVLREGCINMPLVLHDDNGSATKRSTLQRLSITPLDSRPRVSNVNTFSESMSRICKYRSDYSMDDYESLSAAQQWLTRFVLNYN
ncbi:hypothetical protein FBG13_07030 [Cobetia marina]|uniref:hypothetical protein n=1 Tax=Cobetia TaxID=204286 RepID=UPI000C5DB756|nr:MULTISPECIES: hypothetical protein [Cobetia]MBK10584.1 hypothetical protein [Cobetia sp.]TKD62719.1 hypothetical protein FBG13_07030 [Cobetia marina]